MKNFLNNLTYQTRFVLFFFIFMIVSFSFWTTYYVDHIRNSEKEKLILEMQNKIYQQKGEMQSFVFLLRQEIDILKEKVNLTEISEEESQKLLKNFKKNNNRFDDFFIYEEESSNLTATGSADKILKMISRSELCQHQSDCHMLFDKNYQRKAMDMLFYFTVKQNSGRHLKVGGLMHIDYQNVYSRYFYLKPYHRTGYIYYVDHLGGIIGISGSLKNILPKMMMEQKDYPPVKSYFSNRSGIDHFIIGKTGWLAVYDQIDTGDIGIIIQVPLDVLQERIQKYLTNHYIFDMMTFFLINVIMGISAWFFISAPLKRLRNTLVHHQEYLDSADFPQDFTGQIAETFSGLIAEIMDSRENLRKKADYISLMLDQTEAGYLLFDQKGNILKVNRSLIHLFEYADSLQLIGRHYSFLFPPDFNSENQIVFENTLFSSSHNNNLEMVGLTRNKNKVFVSMTASRVFDENDSINVECYLIDISEKIRYQKQIQIIQKEWEAVFQSLTDGVMIIDENYHILRVNHAFANLLSLPESKIIGRYCYEFFNENINHYQGYCPLRKSLQDNQINSSEIRTVVNGKEYFFNITVAPIVEENIQKVKKYIHISRDITIYKMQQSEINKQLMFIRSLMNTVPVPLYNKDNDLVFINCNQAFADLFGTYPEQIIGKSVYDLFPVQVSDEIFRRENELLEGQDKTGFFELAFQDKQKQVHEMIVYHSVFHDYMNENSHGLIGVMFDQKKIHHLERKIKERDLLYQFALKSVKEGIWDYDVGSGTMIVNPNFYEIIHIDKTRNDFIIRIDEIDKKIDRSQIKNFMLSADNVKKIQEEEFSFRTLIDNGTESGEWVKFKGNVVERNPNGEPTRIVGIIADIEEEIGAEEMLKDSMKEKDVQIERLMKNTGLILSQIFRSGPEENPSGFIMMSNEMRMIQSVEFLLNLFELSETGEFWVDMKQYLDKIAGQYPEIKIKIQTENMMTAFDQALMIGMVFSILFGVLAEESLKNDQLIVKRIALNEETIEIITGQRFQWNDALPETAQNILKQAEDQLNMNWTVSEEEKEFRLTARYSIHRLF